MLNYAVFYHVRSDSVSFHCCRKYYTSSRYCMFCILDRVCTVFSFMCIEIERFMPYFAVWGMTTVSTSFALYCIRRNTEDAEMQGWGNDHAPIYIYILETKLRKLPAGLRLQAGHHQLRGTARAPGSREPLVVGNGGWGYRVWGYRV